MPPVAIGVAWPGDTVAARHDARRKQLVVQRNRPRAFLHRAERVARDDGEAVDVRAVEPRDVDGRDDVAREHAIERSGERDRLGSERDKRQMCTKPCACLVARDHIEELCLRGGLRRFVRGRFRHPLLLPMRQS
jgi:hypothetical protein